ncbi:MAG: prepilin peptidase [Minisyncoccota bacterium]
MHYLSPYLFFSILFVFGTAVGSFLNVVILRLNTGRTVVHGRSMCFSCGKPLRAHELVPLLSFLIQRGRCRQCKSKISWQYPLVEFATGILFMLVGTALPGVMTQPFLLAYYLVAVSILVIIAVYDLRHQIIPDGLVYTFALLSLGHLAVQAGSVAVFFSAPYIYDVLAGPLFALPLAGLWVVSRGRWIGLGDAKLALGMGWFLGIAAGASALMLSFWIGAVVGLALIVAAHMHTRLIPHSRYSLKSEIPFGPFMVLATFVVLFCHFNIFNLWIAVIW